MRVMIKGNFIKNEERTYQGQKIPYSVILVDDEICKVKNLFLKDLKPLDNVTLEVDISSFENKLYAKRV